MSEADGIEDAVDGAMRTGLMVAARIGEQLARMREQEKRTIAAAEEQRARELQEHFDAQRAAARAQLAPVSRDDWFPGAPASRCCNRDERLVARSRGPTLGASC